MSDLYIGTCSWKYPSWQGLVYSKPKDINYLEEYARHYNTVEIDQWFWSLFGDKVVLPDIKTAEAYAKASPEGFLFTIKVPNSITLTHKKSGGKNFPEPNPHFLSQDLFEQFLHTIEPIRDKTAYLIFQFEYLNKKKMESLPKFQVLFNDFISGIPPESPRVAIELRNPNYLTNSYFKFLSEYKITPVLLHGYYMPPVWETINKFKDLINDSLIIRLHGPDRSGMDKISGENWNKIYADSLEELRSLAAVINELAAKEVDIYLNINDHFEGSAPLTIERMQKLIQI